MTYQETVSWMFDQLPMYQRQGSSAYRKDLTNIKLLCDYLGHPQKNLRCIHVAGTNGKGSTSHMLASILTKAGFTTGLFTSPHLKDYRERIKINGEEITEDFVVAFVEKHKNFFESNDLSFFEMTTGLAFEYFKQSKTDYCIIETGMGGRLDATNIITPILSVITNIGFDHTRFLGETYAAIATEKAGIIKPAVPVIIGEYNTETKPVFEARANQVKAPIEFAQTKEFQKYPTDLLGSYQIHNQKTVLAAIDCLRKLGVKILDEHISEGLKHAAASTKLSGRWQKLGEKPTIICDTAHNAEGFSYVATQILEQEFAALHMVIGMVNDKDPDSLLSLMPKDARFYFCKPDLPRGLDASALMQKAARFNLKGKAYDSVPDAYSAALKNAAAEDLIFIGGSTFVVAEIL
jgi:dihydrofolate synthase / folylpolyglutamate synthase